MLYLRVIDIIAFYKSDIWAAPFELSCQMMANILDEYKMF